VEFLTSTGLGFLKIIALLLPVVVAGYVGTKAAERGVRTWQCWVIGIATLLLLAVMFWPAVGVLQSAICKHSSAYEACMDDPGPEDWV
jgi:hypothetical protein